MIRWEITKKAWKNPIEARNKYLDIMEKIEGLEQRGLKICKELLIAYIEEPSVSLRYPSLFISAHKKPFTGPNLI